MLSQSHEALDQTGLCPILWLSRELLLPAAAPHHRGLLGYRVWIESDPLLRPDRAAPGQAGQVCKATAQLQYRNRARKTSPRKQDRYAQTHIEHGPGREKQAAQYQQLAPPPPPENQGKSWVLAFQSAATGLRMMYFDRWGELVTAGPALRVD